MPQQPASICGFVSDIEGGAMAEVRPSLAGVFVSGELVLSGEIPLSGIR